MLNRRVCFVLGLFTLIFAFGAPAAARAQGTCGALPPSSGAIIDVAPSQAGSLQAIVDSARSGDSIHLLDGVYSLPQTLVLRTPGVTLRSKSGNRDAVVLDGGYAARDLLLIQQSNVTVADVTLTRAYWHLVHVVPATSTLTGTLLHNIRAVDGSEQFIKVNPANGQYADEGTVRCSFVELTDTGRGYVRNNCYTGGIDVHQGRGWQVYANTFSGFWCASGLSEHAIHFWNGSRDTLVDRNLIINSARGIGFGLGATVTGRTYSDAPCGGAANVGHYGGAITNNFVVANDPRLFASGYGFDTGIGLEQSCESNVLHNSVASTTAPRSSSIEWRFTNTNASIANNLVTHTLVARDGARAITAGNLTNAPLSVFVDVANADLHLVPSATVAIDKGALLASPLSIDIDGDPRSTVADVGADEYYAATAPPPPPPAGDIEPPSIEIVSPINGQRVSKPISVRVATSDNVAVSRVELYVDGVRAGESTAAPFTIKWNPRTVASGTRTLQAMAYDAAGNSAASPVVTVYRQ